MPLPGDRILSCDVGLPLYSHSWSHPSSPAWIESSNWLSLHHIQLSPSKLVLGFFHPLPAVSPDGGPSVHWASPTQTLRQPWVFFIFFLYLPCPSFWALQLSILPPQQFKYIEFTARYDDMKDREGWHAAVCGVAKSGTRLSDWTTTMIYSAMPSFCLVKVKVAQSCPTLCDSMDLHSPWNSPARILEWVAFPFSSRSSRPRNWTGVCPVVIINNKARCRCLMFAFAPLFLQKSIPSSLLPIHLATRPEHRSC